MRSNVFTRPRPEAAVVNLLTFGLALFATSRLVTRLGMPFTLALLLVFICAGLLSLAFAPILTVLLAVHVARQAGNYGVNGPAREMLFTHVDRETRYKSKPVIDVGVYRGGDALSSILFAGLTDGVGLGIAGLNHMPCSGARQEDRDQGTHTVPPYPYRFNLRIRNAYLQPGRFTRKRAFVNTC